MSTMPEIKRLDKDWVDLIKQAKAMGMSREEIRDYFNNRLNNREN